MKAADFYLELNVFQNECSEHVVTFVKSNEYVDRTFQ